MAILLDAYAARSCPVKTQNAYDKTVTAAEIAVPSAGLQEIFAGSADFKDVVLPQLLAASPDAVDLRGLPDPERRDQTLAALTAGVRVIVGPRLPLDLEGHRRGSPDALIRSSDSPNGGPGYLPVQVKRRALTEKQRQAISFTSWAPLGRPFFEESTVAEEWSFRTSREAELLQVAHYWRSLEAHGFAPAIAPVGGLISTDTQPFVGPDQVVEPAHFVTWVQLTHKFLRTFSRTAKDGWRFRSALERYDHEFGFRVRVAEVASQRTSPADHVMVTPVVIRECEYCQWSSVCMPALDDDDLSKRILKSPLDVREITVLRSLGVATLTDLVNTDIDELLPRYLPEVRHRPGADKRLILAAKRARLIVEGVTLERLTEEPIATPTAEIEIDFDIETASDGRIYLWGFYVDDHSGNPWYKAFGRFEKLDVPGEIELAIEAITWLNALCGERSALVFHYSSYELDHLRKIGQLTDDPAVHAVIDRADELFVDLYATMSSHFFGTNGLGLKTVAAEGPKFEWRDIDPSGLNSQAWFTEAVVGETDQIRDAARTRVLEYNEDDVRATHALRDWLRREHSR